MEYVCQICGVEFNRPCPSKNYKYCSIACRGKAYSNRIERHCEICGELLHVKPSVMANGGGKYCSRKCSGRAQSISRRGDANACWKGGEEKRICEYCGKIFHAKAHRINKGGAKYCSYHCSNTASHSGEKSGTWMGGKSFEQYPIDFNNMLKESIRERDSWTCQECGKHQRKEYKKLSIHHIDYDKNNNDPRNLISLCVSCHMKTNTSRDCWKMHLSLLGVGQNSVF